MRNIVTKCYRTCCGKLYGIAYQVDKNLHNALGVAINYARGLSQRLDAHNLQIFLVKVGAHNTAALLQLVEHIVDVKGDFFNLYLIVLQLVVIRKIVQQMKQRHTAAAYIFKVMRAVLGAQAVVVENIAKTDNCVERTAQLVGNV